MGKNLSHFRPVILLHDHLAGYIPLAKRINRYWLQRQLHVAINRAKLRSTNLITLIYDPFQSEYLGLAGESFSAYDCYDEYTAWKRGIIRTKAQMLKREKAILGQVDVVFAVSEKIQGRIKKLHSRVHVVPNGADARHFGRAADPMQEIAPEITMISHPIVGYLGNITSRIDFDLIRYLAVSHPEWSVVLVGGVTEPGFSIPGFVAKLPNIHYLGARPYETLPGYLRAFDVCIIPYVADNSLNIHCSPLKLYEYMAIGKPIVSTDLPAVRPFENIVYIAQSSEGFERHIAEVLRQPNEEKCRQRLAAAEENSWEKRAGDILYVLGKRLIDREKVWQ